MQTTTTSPHRESQVRNGKQVRTVLVDTSLLIELQKTIEEATPVRQALMPFRFKAASSYSRLEYKRAWICRWANIHAYCCQDGVNHIGDVLKRIQKAGRSRWGNRRLMTMLSQLIEFHGMDTSDLPDRVLVARLREHAKRRALAMSETFASELTHVFRGTHCVRAEEPVRERRTGSLDAAIADCRPDNAECRIEDFFIEHRQLFLRIADAVEKLDKPSDELAALAEHVRLADKDPTHLRDNRHCPKIADAIIAIDGHAMDVFAANNPGEWETIADALRKELINPCRPT